MANPSESNGSDSNNNRNRSHLWLVGLAVFLTAVGLLGYRYYQRSRHYEWSDDAFLQATVTTISPQVAGRVVKVCVKDNERVKAGDLLVVIDSRPIEAQLAEVEASSKLSQARMDTAKLNVTLTKDTTGAGVKDAQAKVATAQSGVLEATAGVKAAEAEEERATRDAHRIENLLKQHAVSPQQRDTAVATARVAEARLLEARKRLAGAQSDLDAAQARLAQAKTAPQQVAVSQSQVKQYQAEIAQSDASKKQLELNLSFTKIYAPNDGQVTTKTVEEGEFVQVGQPLMALVARDTYVIANFKEVQLTYMRPKQPVTVTVDAFPGLTLKAHVDSIQAGTGAEFSLIPPQNATGNYVKVVQRVPVKIVFDQALPANLPLVPGMSVVPDVRVR